MQVVLQETVYHLGLVGDVIDVSAGYYRNFLSPRKLAMAASHGNIRQAAHQKKLIEAVKIKQKVIALELKGRMEAVGLSFQHAAGQTKLFGSITSNEIYESLKTKGFEVGKKFIQMEGPIRTLGEHGVKIKLHPEVIAEMKVTVTKKEEVAEKGPPPQEVKKTRKKKEEKEAPETPA